MGEARATIKHPHTGQSSSKLQNSHPCPRADSVFQEESHTNSRAEGPVRTSQDLVDMCGCVKDTGKQLGRDPVPPKDSVKDTLKSPCQRSRGLVLLAVEARVMDPEGLELRVQADRPPRSWRTKRKPQPLRASVSPTV